ncbi:MAG: hypothetical protein JHD16_14080 [Solirubrobacteraceae bacterium]|nr:hypothetical protein [Solirubrobacteraceae bacterium]
MSTLFEPPAPRLLAVDWVSRQVDAGLPFGLAVLTVPVYGGSRQAWQALVSDLQTASVREPSSADGGFHLISAVGAADGGWLEVGIFATGDQESLLREQLDAAVERVNAAGS